MTEDQKYERSWHLDKKVPIALIVTIFAQTAAFGWFTSALFHRVDTLERDASAARVVVEREISLRGPQADRLTRVEVKLETIQEGVTEIKRAIQSRPATFQ